MKKYDVVIIGFGPTGGTLANLLALHGFSILIVEKEKSFYPLPRAVHFDDEIMRVFQTIGITDKFLKHTIINKGTKFVNSKNKEVLDWPRPRSVTENGWYPSYRFHQPDLERKLRGRLKDFKKVTIMQNTKVVNLKEDKNSVKIILENIFDKIIFILFLKFLILFLFTCCVAYHSKKRLLSLKRIFLVYDFFIIFLEARLILIDCTFIKVSTIFL